MSLDKGMRVKLWGNSKMPEAQKALVDKIGTVISSSDRIAVVQLEETVNIDGDEIRNFIAPIEWLERVN